MEIVSQFLHFKQLKDNNEHLKHSHSGCFDV